MTIAMGSSESAPRGNDPLVVNFLQLDLADVRGFARPDGGILECEPAAG